MTISEEELYKELKEYRYNKMKVKGISCVKCGSDIINIVMKYLYEDLK